MKLKSYIYAVYFTTKHEYNIPLLQTTITQYSYKYNQQKKILFVFHLLNKNLN